MVPCRGIGRVIPHTYSFGRWLNKTDWHKVRSIMFCVNCGKSIPENSIFCLFCGEKQTVGTDNIKSPLTPSKICDLEFVFMKPEKRSRIKGIVFNGFAVAFSLQDIDGHLIGADGKAELRIRAGTIQKTFQFEVNRESFGQTYVQQSEGNRREFFGYLFYYDKPEFPSYNFATRMETQGLVELWFTTSDNRKLFAKNF